MSAAKTLVIRFYLDREEDRRAYEFLRSTGKTEYGSHSRAVVAAVDGFFSRREEASIVTQIEKAVERALRAALPESLSAYSPMPAAMTEDPDVGANLDAALDYLAGL